MLARPASPVGVVLSWLQVLLWTLDTAQSEFIHSFQSLALSLAKWDAVQSLQRSHEGRVRGHLYSIIKLDPEVQLMVVR